MEPKAAYLVAIVAILVTTALTFSLAPKVEATSDIIEFAQFMADVYPNFEPDVYNIVELGDGTIQEDGSFVISGGYMLYNTDDIAQLQALLARIDGENFDQTDHQFFLNFGEGPLQQEKKVKRQKYCHCSIKADVSYTCDSRGYVDSQGQQGALPLQNTDEDIVHSAKTPYKCNSDADCNVEQCNKYCEHSLEYIYNYQLYNQLCPSSHPLFRAGSASATITDYDDPICY